MNTIRGFAADDATIIFGAVYDDPIGEKLRVTVIGPGSPAAVARPAKPQLVVAEDGVPTHAGGGVDTGFYDECPP